MLTDDLKDDLAVALRPLERFGFNSATLVESEDAWIDLWTSNRFLTLGFRNYRGDFIAQGLFNVKPLPEQSISHFVPIVADPAVLARRGFGPALIGLQQTVAYVEAWSIAISESIPDILGGDYRRVKELQAAH